MSANTRTPLYSNTVQLSLKVNVYIGWVSFLNPTKSSKCWVSLRSTQPTILLTEPYSSIWRTTIFFVACNFKYIDSNALDFSIR
ncbi:MAG: hypothetical protein EA343_06155 [Nodularia sp. (in: Bacteria)]|nr:MAG: hypothetical protein EA343_06155 [Nodularia sp. (in: cyanobacteria)]